MNPLILLTVGVFVCVVSITVQVTASPTDCGEIFQSQLTELIATKQTCESAYFKDCCQVGIIIMYVTGYRNNCVIISLMHVNII